LAIRIFALRGFFMMRRYRKSGAVHRGCAGVTSIVVARVATSRTIVEPSAQPGSFQIRSDPAHMVQRPMIDHLIQAICDPREGSSPRIPERLLPDSLASLRKK
jgi:hypothetical protein